CSASEPEAPVYVARDRRLNLERQLIGERERAVPVAVPDQLSDQAHAQLDGELAVPAAAGKLEARLDARARLLVAVPVQREHGEVVVGAQRLGNEVVPKRDCERLSEQRARLVGPPSQEQRLRVQRLGEHCWETLSLGDLERELDALRSRLVVALEMVDSPGLSGQPGDVLVRLVLGEHCQGGLEKLEGLLATPERPEGQAE